MRKFHGAKVLVTFAAEEQKFQGTKVPWNESSWTFRFLERMFHGTKVPRERKFSLWTFRSLEERSHFSVALVVLFALSVCFYLLSALHAINYVTSEY